MYQKGVAEQLVSYTNADWAGNTGNHIESTTISWSTKKKSIIALSSIEAEYKEAVFVTCEAIWIKRQLKDLRVEVSEPTVIYYNNLSNIQLSKNPVFHA